MTDGTGTAAPAARAGHVSWRRRLLLALIAVIGVTAAVHAFGGQPVGITGISVAGLVVLGFVILRLPHLRKHFHNPYKRPSGSGSLNYPGQRGLGLRRPAKAGGKGPGLPRLMRPHRSGSPSPPQRRRGGAGLLRRSSRAGGTGPARSGSRRGGMLRSRRSAGTATRARRGRSPGSGRGGAGSALAGRRAARRFSAGRSRSGRAGSRGALIRRTGTGTRRRAGTGPGRRASAGGRLPSRWHPLARRHAAVRRRGAGGGIRTGGAGAGRRLPSRWHPLARRRTVAARRRAGTGRRPDTGRPGTSRRQPSRWLPVTWWRGSRRKAGTGRGPGTGTPGQPGRVRRGWHRLAGTPDQRITRRVARRAHRARIRARKNRLAVNAYARRTHGWAFWRRWTRRTPRTHAATGRTLNRRERLSRWWHLRWHRGPGRARRSPRPLLGGAILGSPGLQRFRASALGRRIARLDRQRRDRWLRRRRGYAPAAVRRPSVPVPAVPGFGASPARTSTNRTSTGGRSMDTHAMADEIRSMGGHEFADPQDVHDTLAGMHELIQSMQDVLNGWGLSLSETGTHPAYAEAVQEAAGSMAGIADQLQGVTAGGVMRGPGG